MFENKINTNNQLRNNKRNKLDEKVYKGEQHTCCSLFTNKLKTAQIFEEKKTYR